MDRRQIENTLNIKNPNKETIFGILGRMEVLLDLFKRNRKYTGLIPFLETYYLVTKSVAEKSVENKSFYNDFDALQKLDIHFASLYFKALKKYLETGKSIKPWKKYFEYCEKDDGNTALQILLGINAHINGDLFTSLYKTKYSNTQDFNKINRILEEQIPKIIHFLIFEQHDVLTGIEAIIARKLIHREFKKVVVKWRCDAWNNCQKSDEVNFEINKINALNETENIADHMIQILDNFHLFRSSETISNFNNLRVMLVS